MSHLTTVPDRQELMQPFINISAARMSAFAQVTQLHSRLDLLLTHVTKRQQEIKQSDAEPALLVYRDGKLLLLLLLKLLQLLLLLLLK